MTDEPQIATFGPATSIESGPSKLISLEDAFYNAQTKCDIPKKKCLAGGKRAHKILTAHFELVAVNNALKEKISKMYKAILYAFALGIFVGVAMAFYLVPTLFSFGFFRASSDHESELVFAKCCEPKNTETPTLTRIDNLTSKSNKKCKPIGDSPDDKAIAEIHYSLLHYIVKDDLVGLSSYRVNADLCYMVLQKGDDVFAMGDPKITEVDWLHSFALNLPPAYCPNKDHPKEISRSWRIWVSYKDPRNNWRETTQNFTGTLAWAFQEEFAILNGLSVCDGSDMGTVSLPQLMA